MQKQTLQGAQCGKLKCSMFFNSSVSCTNIKLVHIDVVDASEWKKTIQTGRNGTITDIHTSIENKQGKHCHSNS